MSPAGLEPLIGEMNAARWGAGILWSVRVRPTLHFLQRFQERVQTGVAVQDLSDGFEANGVLSPGRSQGEYILRVRGLARFILKDEGGGCFVGITVLPPKRPSLSNPLSLTPTDNLLVTDGDSLYGVVSNG